MTQGTVLEPLQASYEKGTSIPSIIIERMDWSHYFCNAIKSSMLILIPNTFVMISDVENPPVEYSHGFYRVIWYNIGWLLSNHNRIIIG